MYWVDDATQPSHHTTVSLTYSADTETTSRWEKVVINDGMLPTGIQTPDQLDLKTDDAHSYGPHH